MKKLIFTATLSLILTTPAFAFSSGLGKMIAQELCFKTTAPKQISALQQKEWESNNSIVGEYTKRTGKNNCDAITVHFTKDKGVRNGKPLCIRMQAVKNSGGCAHSLTNEGFITLVKSSNFLKTASLKFEGPIVKS